MPDFIVIPDGNSSVLDAVNYCITSLGETPVSTIDPPPTSDVDIALLMLAQANKEVQGRGWSWNREEAYPLTVGVDGRVALPENTDRVTSAYYNTHHYAPTEIIQRGDYLYDTSNHTYTFTVAPTVDLITRLQWEYLPQAARSLIMVKGCMAFQARLQERSPVFRVTADQVSTALTILEQHEDETSKHNVLTGNIGVQSGLGGSVRRNRRGIS